MKTRLAPSPTGYLHLGHAYSAWLTEALAKAQGLEVLLRVEDIDHTRCKPEYIEAIQRDYKALNISHKKGAIRQSERFEIYQQALDALWGLGLLYPCTCTRADLQNATQNTYPGTCRHKTMKDVQAGTPYALRLNLEKAILKLQALKRWPLTFMDSSLGAVTVDPTPLGDAVIARKEFKTSYHLSVVCDDDAQGITHVIRGADLYEMTHLHRLLQELLDLPSPEYTHHGLIAEEGNEKLSKSLASKPIAKLIEEGLDLQALKAVFERVETIQDEPGKSFIQALPDKVAQPLRFVPFKG